MKKFKKILNEEMGIADKVVSITHEIYNEIEKSIRNREYQKDEHSRLIGNIKVYIFDCKVSLSYEYLNFQDKMDYYYSKAGKLGYGWSTFLDKKLSLMFVEICAVSGTIIKDLAYDSIQHEVEHIYQQYLAGKEFKKPMEYARVMKDMSSKNDIERKAGRLVYGCIKSEQEGFSNGLYSFLMMVKAPYVDDEIYDSPAWSLYTEMKQTLKEAKYNQQLRDYIKAVYGMSIKDIEHAINNFLRRMSRAVLKARYDKFAKQGWKR